MAGLPGACRAGAGRRGLERRPRRGRARAPYGGARAGRGAIWRCAGRAGRAGGVRRLAAYGGFPAASRPFPPGVRRTGARPAAPSAAPLPARARPAVTPASAPRVGRGSRCAPSRVSGLPSGPVGAPPPPRRCAAQVRGGAGVPIPSRPAPPSPRTRSRERDLSSRTRYHRRAPRHRAAPQNHRRAPRHHADPPVPPARAVPPRRLAVHVVRGPPRVGEGAFRSAPWGRAVRAGPGGVSGTAPRPPPRTPARSRAASASATGSAAPAPR